MTSRLSSSSVEVTRLRFDSDRTFDAVRDALLAHMGKVTSAEIGTAIAASKTPDAFAHNVNAYAGDTGFMLFFEVDHSRYLPLYGVTRRVTRLIFGNPAIAATMTQHDIAAALFAPVELLLYEPEDHKGAIVIYDLPSALMQADKHPDLWTAAQALDAKMHHLVSIATGVDAR